MCLRGRQFLQPGQNALGKAGAAAVLYFVSATAQNGTHVASPQELTARVASFIIAAGNATMYPPFPPLLRKLELV